MIHLGCAAPLVWSEGLLGMLYEENRGGPAVFKNHAVSFASLLHSGFTLEGRTGVGLLFIFVTPPKKAGGEPAGGVTWLLQANSKRLDSSGHR